jgi:hypothetical protein
MVCFEHYLRRRGGRPKGAALQLGSGALLPRRLKFRTIQVCPKDLPAVLRQVERAEDRPNGSVGGR